MAGAGRGLSRNAMTFTIKDAARAAGRRKAATAALLMACAAAALGARACRRRAEGTLSPPLSRGPIVESIYGIGTVMASRTYQIKVGVVSHIRALKVREGDRVAKGQPLLDLDGVIYRAPFAGTVTFLPYKVGENIFAGSAALVLADLQDRYLVVSFEQQAALRLRPGQNAVLSFETLREERFSGAVEAIYSYNGSFLARVDVSTLPASVLPDMTADVAIEVARKEQALTAPASAIDRGALWVKRGRGLPRRVPVQTGIVDKDLVEIVKGDVSAGDRVLIKPRPGP